MLEEVLSRERVKAALSLQLMEKSNRPLHYWADTFREKRPRTKRWFILQAEKEGTRAGRRGQRT